MHLSSLNLYDLARSIDELSLKRIVNKYRIQFPLRGPIFNEKLDRSHLQLELTNGYLKPRFRFTYISMLYYDKCNEVIVCGVITDYEVIKHNSEREFIARVLYHKATRMLRTDGRTSRTQEYLSKQCEMGSTHTFKYMDLISYWVLSSKNQEIFPPLNHPDFNYVNCNKIHHRGYIDWTQAIKYKNIKKYRFSISDIYYGLYLNKDLELKNPNFTEQLDYLYIKRQFELLNQYAFNEIHNLFHIPDIYSIIAAY